MNYTDDTCMSEFSLEQSRRMRCSLENYRSAVFAVAPDQIFNDGFESGDTSKWSSDVP